MFSRKKELRTKKPVAIYRLSHASETLLSELFNPMLLCSSQHDNSRKALKITFLKYWVISKC